MSVARPDAPSSTRSSDDACARTRQQAAVRVCVGVRCATPMCAGKHTRCARGRCAVAVRCVRSAACACACYAAADVLRAACATVTTVPLLPCAKDIAYHDAAMNTYARASVRVRARNDHRVRFRCGGVQWCSAGGSGVRVRGVRQKGASRCAAAALRAGACVRLSQRTTVRARPMPIYRVSPRSAVAGVCSV